MGFAVSRPPVARPTLDPGGTGGTGAASRSRTLVGTAGETWADSLDPEDWTELRALGHRMVDDMFDHLQTLRDGPVWRPMPEAARQELRGRLPRQPILPARCMTISGAWWSLTPPAICTPASWAGCMAVAIRSGMLAEFLAAGLNANLGGRDHAPIEVERQVIAWSAEMLGFPPEASGVLVTGTSIANLIGVLVARSASLGPSVRHDGLGDSGLVAYTSAAAHGCVPRAMDMAGSDKMPSD